MKNLDKQNIEDIFVLTPMQEGMLFHYLKEPEGEQYFEQLSLGLSGKIDRNTFEKAWDFVIKTNETLRTVFHWEKLEKPWQVILKEHKLKPNYYDCSHGEECEKKRQLEEIKIRERQEKFDLQEVPFRVSLCKFQEDKYEMIISSHHILYDGWSNAVILKEFFKAYGDLPGENELKTTPPKSKYKDFAKWLQNQDTKKQEKYWSNYLKGFDSGTGLSVKVRRKDNAVPKGPGNYRITFSREITNGLEACIKKYKITLAALIYSVCGILMQRYNNCEDITMGTTVSGRPANIKGIEDMVGLFINTLPLRLHIHSHEMAIDLIYEIKEVLEQRKEYESTPLTDIKKYSLLDSQEELFDTLVVIENYPLDSRFIRENSHLSLHSYSVFEMTNYDLTIRIAISDEIEANFIYNKACYDEITIRNLPNHFTSILKEIIACPGKKIAKIDVFTEEEKKQVLYLFNETDSLYPRAQTIVELFATQVNKNPDRGALVSPNQCLTYRELNKRANRVGQVLKGKEVGPNCVVGLMVERSIEMMVELLGILKAGGAYMPLDPGYPEERIKYMLKDSGAKVLVTTHTLATEFDILRSREGKKNFEILFIDTHSSPYHLIIDLPNFTTSQPPNFPLLPATGNRQPATSLAYIIYTSGSTGNPKGVMVEHAAVMNVLFALQAKYPFKKSDAYLLKTPVVFDVSVTELFGWFFGEGGGRLALLAKDEEKDPEKILEAIASAGVTHINFVPSMFNVFAAALNSQNLKKLSGLRYIFLAGEALLPGLVNQFRGLNTGIALENIYGPTEAAIYASWYSLSQWTGSGMIPIGKPLPNVKFYIMDKDEQWQGIGVPGELCIAGAGIARGYLNNPELTAEKFCLRRPGTFLLIGCKSLLKKQEFLRPPEEITGSLGAPISAPHDGPLGPSWVGAASPFLKKGSRTSKNFLLPQGRLHLRAKSQEPRAIFYKTGDLARWLPDGNIEFLGRMDRQVKVRGFRIELGEIESRMMNYDSVREAVVTIHQDDSGGKDLCAYVVPSASHLLNFTEIRDYLSQTLPEYMIPTYFVKMEKIPHTSSGKTDRKALVKVGITRETGSYTAPRSDIEKKLAEIWSGILRIEKEKIGIDVNFFRIGGHSLKATALASKIHKTFNKKVSPGEIFEMPTIRELSQFILGGTREEYCPIEPVESKEYYALSSAQKRLYVTQQMDETGVTYNMPYFIRVQGTPDKARLEDIFQRLIRRHESLRTSFTTVEDNPVQRIQNNVKFEIKYAAASSDRVEKILEDFIRPFDLTQAPLLRVELIGIKDQEYILMLDMHHIISDGVSMAVFEREVAALSRGENLSALRVQYKDFSGWQNSREYNTSLKKQEDYWLKVFSHKIRRLNVPPDYPRDSIESVFVGEVIEFELEDRLTKALKEMAAQREVTLYMILLAAYNVLLSRYSGHEDIVVGTPVSGRTQADLEHIIGMFVNVLAIRNYPRGKKTFREFLAEVKTNSLEAFENQDYQFELLLQALNLDREVGRNPLVDTTFVVQNMERSEIRMEGLTFVPYPYQNKTAKFEMVLEALEQEEKIVLVLQYAAKLFKRETMKTFFKHYLEIINAVAENEDVKLMDIELIPGDKPVEIMENLDQAKEKFEFDF